MKKVYINLTAALFLSLSLPTFASEKTIPPGLLKDKIQQFLDFMTINGNHPIPQNGLPAMDINVTNKQDGIRQINTEIANQMEAVTQAFQNASENEKDFAVAQAAKGFNSELGSQAIASIKFINRTPSGVKRSV